MDGSNVDTSRVRGRGMDLKTLIGSGDRIALFTLPFAVVALALWAGDPSRFAIDGPPQIVGAIALVVLAVGLVGWAWSAALILLELPKGGLITNGPFAIARHPLYTSVALLVLPSAGILLRTWLGVVVGAALYVGSRLFAPAEERALRRRFGSAWESYSRNVKLSWL